MCFPVFPCPCRVVPSGSRLIPTCNPHSICSRTCSHWPSTLLLGPWRIPNSWPRTMKMASHQSAKRWKPCRKTAWSTSFYKSVSLPAHSLGTCSITLWLDVMFTSFSIRILHTSIDRCHWFRSKSLLIAPVDRISKLCELLAQGTGKGCCMVHIRWCQGKTRCPILFGPQFWRRWALPVMVFRWRSSPFAT